MSDEFKNAGWGMRSADAMSENISSIIRLNLSGTGYFRRVNRAGAKTDFTLPDVPVIKPKIGGLFESSLILRTIARKIGDSIMIAIRGCAPSPESTQNVSAALQAGRHGQGMGCNRRLRA